MAHQDNKNLKKIAQEFAMIEEMCSRMRRLERQPHDSHVPNSYQIWRNYPPPKTIDSNQAAKKYGGVIVMEGWRKYRV